MSWYGRLLDRQKTPDQSSALPPGPRQMADALTAFVVKPRRTMHRSLSTGKVSAILRNLPQFALHFPSVAMHAEEALRQLQRMFHRVSL